MFQSDISLPKMVHIMQNTGHFYWTLPWKLQCITHNQPLTLFWDEGWLCVWMATWMAPPTQYHLPDTGRCHRDSVLRFRRHQVVQDLGDKNYQIHTITISGREHLEHCSNYILNVHKVLWKSHQYQLNGGSLPSLRKHYSKPLLFP